MATTVTATVTTVTTTPSSEIPMSSIYEKQLSMIEKTTCIACLNGWLGQAGHMEPGGCLEFPE